MVNKGSYIFNFGDLPIVVYKKIEKRKLMFGFSYNY